MSKRQTKGFFARTNHKIWQDQTRKAESWFRGHPTTFFAVWGTKSLVWNVPKAVLWKTPRAIGRGMRGETSWERAWNGRERANQQQTVFEPETVILAPSKQATAPNTTGGTTLTHIQRITVLDTGRAMLTTTPLGRAFSALAGEYEAFMPVAAFPHSSTLYLFTESHVGFGALEAGLESWAEVVDDYRINALVTDHVNLAVDCIGDAASEWNRGASKINDLYGSMLDQETGGNGLVLTGGVQGRGGEPTRAGALASGIAAHYASFEPSTDHTVTSILEYVKAAQAGLAMVSLAVEQAARVLPKYRIDQRVRQHAEAAGDHLRSASVEMRSARRLMQRLHGPHLQQEAAGVPVIVAGRII